MKKQKTRKELMREIKGLKVSRNKWLNECHDLRAALWVLKRQLTRMANNIKTSKSSVRCHNRIKYISGGKL